MRWAALLMAIVAIALSGCGAKYDNVAPPLPTDSASATVHDCKASTDKPNLDLTKIEGQQYVLAEEYALKHGYAMRQSFVDGEPRAQTMDYSKTRLNVSVNNGKVTRFCGIG